MTIPLAKAKEVCTSSELALVSASRSPQVRKLSPARLRALTGRARKALDKWQDLSRAQARAGTTKQRTRLKAKLFRDALDRFEARAVAVRRAGGSSAAAGGKRAGQAKRARAMEHRKARAATREKLAEATPSWDMRAKAGGSGAVRRRRRSTAAKAKRGPRAKGGPKTTGRSQAKGGREAKGSPEAPAGAARRHRPPLKWADVLGGAKFPGSPDQQRAVRTRVKQSRLAESGKTSRERAHVAASGKRAQARRDRKRSGAGR